MGRNNRYTLSNGMREWCCRFEDDGDPDERTAVIYQPIDGSHSMVLHVATVDCIPCQPDEDGDPELIREGEDAERLRKVVLITHAPTMLHAIQRAEEKLSELVTTGMRQGGWDTGGVVHDVWRTLAQIQSDLERIKDMATDVENF